MPSVFFCFASLSRTVFRARAEAGLEIVVSGGGGFNSNSNFGGGGFGGGGFGGGGFGGGLTQLDQTQIDALAACLEGRGFEVPDDASTLQALFGGGLPSAELQEALQDCGTEVGVSLPDGFGGGGFGGGAPDAEELRECLSAEGLDVEELAPSPDEGDGLSSLFADLDRDDPEIQAALEVCAPGFGSRGGSQ